MNTRNAALILLASLIGLGGCATANNGDADWRQGTTTIDILGTPSARFTASVVQNGKRHEFTSSVPFTTIRKGLSEAEFRKVDLADSLSVHARYERKGMHLSFSSTAGPGTPGVRIEVHKGLSVENLKE